MKLFQELVESELQSQKFAWSLGATGNQAQTVKRLPFVTWILGMAGVQVIDLAVCPHVREIAMAASLLDWRLIRGKMVVGTQLVVQRSSQQSILTNAQTPGFVTKKTDGLKIQLHRERNPRCRGVVEVG